MRFTTRHYIRRQCEWLKIRKALEKPLPRYIYFSTQYFGVQP